VDSLSENRIVKRPSDDWAGIIEFDTAAFLKCAGPGWQTIQVKAKHAFFTQGDAGDAGRCGTSMIGNSQGETEIPLDLAEGVLPTGNAFA
jgi:hypothetical protein